MKFLWGLILSLLLPMQAFASTGSTNTLNLTSHWVGFAAIAIFSAAYILVILAY